MAGLPEITITGTLTADPDLRFTATGAAVANFTVAANDRRFDQDSKTWVDGGATFLRCSIWRQAAENVAESLRKGARVVVIGVLKQRSYETPEGENRTVYEVDASEVGASLKWHTAKVAKANRDNPTDAAPAAAGFSSEPPF